VLGPAPGSTQLMNSGSKRLNCAHHLGAKALGSGPSLELPLVEGETVAAGVADAAAAG